MSKKMRIVAATLATVSLVAICGHATERADAKNALAAEKSATEETVYDMVDLSFFDLARYDNAKYLQYYWENEVMYNESAMIVKNADGTLDPVKLLYKPERIISVRSADLTVKYEEGSLCRSQSMERHVPAQHCPRGCFLG
ncbi:MAG: hypothetical protein IJB97_06800 [Clostridia bacterium]|nr:hypothetical protein [Clostridia bacterium]